MSKEEKIQKYESKQLIDELSKMPPMVIATAYLHAINYTMYGEDVTEKWLTATQNTSILEKAYQKGYYDALQIQAEKRLGQNVLDKIRAEIEGNRKEVSNRDSESAELTNYYFGLNDGLKDARDIIDKYKAESEEV